MVQDFYQRVVTRMGSEIEKEDNGELPRIRMGFTPDSFLCPVLVPLLVRTRAQLLSCAQLFAAP